MRRGALRALAVGLIVLGGGALHASGQTPVKPTHCCWKEGVKKCCGTGGAMCFPDGHICWD